jgi:hypothetical protein
VTADPTLSIVIATIGRPTLIATLESLQQLGPQDEVLLLTDGDHPQAAAMLGAARLSCSIRQIVHQPRANDWGHTLRNLYSHLAKGDRVLHIDDDDVYLDGAIDIVRAECSQYPGQLVVFRMLTAARHIPASHEIRVGNIGTNCGALPNVPEKWGRWQPYYGGDGAFYESCRFQVAWCDRAITVERPHQWDCPAEAKQFIHPTHRVDVSGRIPKVFHRIWLGGRPMPDEFKRYGDSWLELNPEWEMRTWSEENLPAIINRTEFEASTTLAGKSDVLRFELLWQFGGVYVDTDFQALKPLGALLDNINTFFADEGPNTPATAILGSVPRDPFYEHLIAAIPDSVRSHDGLVEQTGPGFFAREIDRFLHRDRLIRNLGAVWEHVSHDMSRRLYGFETRFFYPYGYWEQHRRHETFADAYAAHHWAHSWR